MRFTPKLVCGLLLGGLALPAVGDEPDPSGILKKAATATKAVRAVAYKAEARGEGALADVLPRLTGTVRARAVAGLPAPMFVLDASGSDPYEDEPVAARYVCDGKQLLAIDPKRKRAVQSEVPREWGGLVGRMKVGGDLWLPVLFQPSPFGDALAGRSIEYAGTRSVAGVECHVVRVGGVRDAESTLWYLGKRDYLPRRVDRGESGGTRVLVISELDAQPKFGADAFALKVPEGFKVTHTGLLPVGSQAPEWTLRTPAGKPVSLGDLRGKVVVLDFWATWCIPCKKAMPGVQKLHERFAGKPVRVFGVAWNDRGDPAGYMREQGYTYGLLLGGERLTKDYRIRAVPVFYVLGPDGKVLYRRAGYDAKGERELVEIVEQALRPRE